mmetsp:Transcript_949/g.2276  ORF Transcript_949/g.2276 Transcript_949/m.2276 type:complete len:407 (+) Transcript_949:1832-3052(+)
MALSFTVYVKKLPLPVTLTEYAITIEGEDQDKVIAWDDVLGAFLLPTDIPSFALLTNAKRKGTRVLKRFVFVDGGAPQWVNFIQNKVVNGKLQLTEETPRKKYTILVNPFSGRKLAKTNWESVKPFFEACDFEVVFTKYGGHAGEIAENAEPGGTIVLVSGDGLVHEVVNALCKSGKNQQVAVSVIPGGTSNALAYELCMLAGEPYSPESCAFIAVTGKRKASDLMQIELLSQSIVVHAFMTFTWAIVSDIDINSEFMRVLGEARLYLYAVWRVLKLIHYHGRFRWQYLRNTSEDQGPFTYFCISKLKHLSADMKVFPQACLTDGAADALVISPNVRSWFSLIRTLLAVENGGHVNLQGVKYFKAQTWHLEPATVGVYSIDGEAYLSQPMRGTVVPGGVMYVSRCS